MKNSAERKISKRIEEIPKPYRRNYKKAVNGSSRKAAVKAFCLECSLWQENEITDCKAVTCPLYAVRPFAVKRRSLAELARGLFRMPEI
jgi:hypothetical protein